MCTHAYENRKDLPKPKEKWNSYKTDQKRCNSQYKLHPFAAHMKIRYDGKKKTCISICFTSDCLKHDTLAIHTFLKTVIPDIQ